jgi:molybdenum cofactor guanylyltransferase
VVASLRPAIRTAILAGGRATRLGGAKATAQLDGRPLIAYPIEAARSAELDPFVVAKPQSPLPALDCEVVREPQRPAHPLAGMIAALAAAPGAVVVVGCDMPFLTAPLLRLVASLPPPAVASVGGRLEPLLGVYDGSAAETFHRALEGEDPLRQVVAQLEPTEIGEARLERFGAPERLIFSVNTPGDLALAERTLAG